MKNLTITLKIDADSVRQAMQAIREGEGHAPASLDTRTRKISPSYRTRHQGLNALISTILDGARRAEVAQARNTARQPHEREREGFWELDSAKVGRDEWLTLLYDYDSKEVLVERTDADRPSDDQLLDLLSEALDEYEPPEDCTILATRDARGIVRDYLTTNGVTNVYVGTRLPRTGGAERAFRERHAKEHRA